jgi:outer membrane protein assembly factor BamB
VFFVVKTKLKEFIMQVSKSILVFITFVIFTNILIAEDWPRWRGPNANGISTETGWNPAALIGDVQRLWETNIGMGHSSFAIRGKFLYTMGNVDSQDIIYCLDAETGTEYWRFSYDCSAGNYAGPRATPTLDGEYVYTLSREGHVHCLEASSGKLVWKRNMEDEFDAKSPTWGFASSPYIVDNMVVINVLKHGAALNKKTGEPIWLSDATVSGYASPSLMTTNGITQGLFFGETKLYGVDIKSGKELWSYPWKTSYDVNASDPLVIDNQIFITSGYKSGCALLKPGGSAPEVVWKNKSISNQFGGAVYFEGHIYGSDGQVGKSRSKLNCVNVKTGEVVWSEKIGFNSVMMADKKLIVINEKGKLFIAEATPSGFKEISSTQILPKSVRCWTAPILANGKIYCRNTNGDIVCIDVQK